jgi:integrase/recombinase XerD
MLYSPNFSTMTPLRKKMINWMERKNYSPATIKCYVTAVSMLSRYYGKCPSELSEDDIARYMHYIITERGYSQGSVNGAYSGIKLLWKQILDREWNTKLLSRPKRAKELPEILSIEEVRRLIDGTRNRKHKAILRLLYSTGLRMGELVKLKPGDIDPSRWAGSKGQMDKSAQELPPSG